VGCAKYRARKACRFATPRKENMGTGKGLEGKKKRKYAVADPLGPAQSKGGN